MPVAGDELGAWQIVRELTPSRSWLARRASSENGPMAVLKLLEDDCLLDGQLHPSIRQRLKVVRELPEKALASLHGVERERGLAFMVWDYVPGRTLLEAASLQGREDLARHLVLAVQSLHAAGIVHGAIHARNVIVDPDGKMWLTHVSPLLYSDERDDLAAVAMLLQELGCRPVELDGLDELPAFPETPICKRSILLAAAAALAGLTVALTARWMAGS
jgi:hypothetical protein